MCSSTAACCEETACTHGRCTMVLSVVVFQCGSHSQAAAPVFFASLNVQNFNTFINYICAYLQRPVSSTFKLGTGRGLVGDGVGDLADLGVEIWLLETLFTIRQKQEEQQIWKSRDRVKLCLDKMFDWMLVSFCFQEICCFYVIYNSRETTSIW